MLALIIGRGIIDKANMYEAAVHSGYTIYAFQTPAPPNSPPYSTPTFSVLIIPTFHGTISTAPRLLSNALFNHSPSKGQPANDAREGPRSSAVSISSPLEPNSFKILGILAVEANL